jgi:uncharacterized SAM-binding protein YcdF (DUF218 family)
MAVVGSSLDDAMPGTGLARDRTRPASAFMRGIGWVMAIVCVSAPVALALGFLWFVSRVPVGEVKLTGTTDAIVVLTGDAARVSEAIELLATRRGLRLLISGANPATTAVEISRLNPEFARWVRCCVDFDRSLNTLGNAIETRRWAERRRLHSLTVVTSDYHMPRALAEIAHQLPRTRLVPFPVTSDRLRVEHWWANGPAMRLLLTEYLKYIVAQARMRLDLASGRLVPPI